MKEKKKKRNIDNDLAVLPSHDTHFLHQRKLEGHNANNIRQLDPFSESAWDFVLAIFISG